MSISDFLEDVRRLKLADTMLRKSQRNTRHARGPEGQANSPEHLSQSPDRLRAESQATFGSPRAVASSPRSLLTSRIPAPGADVLNEGRTWGRGRRASQARQKAHTPDIATLTEEHSSSLDDTCSGELTTAPISCSQMIQESGLCEGRNEPV